MGLFLQLRSASLLMEVTAAPAGPQNLTSAVHRLYLFSSPDPSCRGGSGEVSDLAGVGGVAGSDP